MTVPLAAFARLKEARVGGYVLGGHYASVGLRLNNSRINPVQLSSQLQDDLASCTGLLA